MNMDKWTEMPADDFLLLADLTKERLKKIKKENIERTSNEIIHCSIKTDTNYLFHI